jgi:hypothetical protein
VPLDPDRDSGYHEHDHADNEERRQPDRSEQRPPEEGERAKRCQAALVSG